MVKSLLTQFDDLMSHLNGEDSEMAQELRGYMVATLKQAQDDAEWRSCLEAGGVDNWEWYDECFPDEDDE